MKKMSTISPNRLVLALAAIALWASLGEARAGSTLWYNGDFDGNSALFNEVIPSVAQGSVYDDFIVPMGQTWTIQSVFSNDQMNFAPTSLSAYWEIRSGVSPGNGGMLLASGTGSATQTATGNPFAAPGQPEYTVTVSGLSVTLGPGTYWLTVDPVGGTIDDTSYISTTSGLNAIGMPPGNDGNSYVAGSYYIGNYGGYDFEPAGDYVTNLNGGQPDFSMGVVGVPEPSTLVLGLIGTLTVFGCACLRRRPRVG